MSKQEMPFIPRTGIIFRAGDYGDKGVYSDSDLEGMVGDVNVPIKMSHHPTILDGHLGFCERASIGYDDEGKMVLLGHWNEPKPLADLLKDTPRSLSVEIDRKSKKLAAVALEVMPHITDAAFFSDQIEAAYASFSRGEEVQPLDEFLRSDTEGESPESLVALYSDTQKEGKPMEDKTVETKGFIDQLRALFSAAKPDELADAESMLTEARTGKTAREIELEQKLAKFEAAQEESQKEQLTTQAVQLADSLVESGVIAAKDNEEYQKWHAAFSIATQVDNEQKDFAYFSKDSSQANFSLVEMFTGLAGQLPKIDGSEKVGGLDPKTIKGVAMFEQSKTTVTDPETTEIQELSLAMSKEYADRLSGVEPKKAA